MGNNNEINIDPDLLVQYSDGLVNENEAYVPQGLLTFDRLSNISFNYSVHSEFLKQKGIYTGIGEKTQEEISNLKLIAEYFSEDDQNMIEEG